MSGWTLDPESGAESATEAALLTQRPRSGVEYERALAGARRSLDPLIELGIMSESEVAREAELLLDISWLAAEGFITLDEMTARTDRLAERHIARANRGGGQ